MDTAPNLTGIFQRLTDPGPHHRPWPTSTLTRRPMLAALMAYGRTRSKTCRSYVGPATYQHASRTFQTATNYKGELSAAAYAMTNAGGLWTNERMPDAASNVQQAIVYRMGRSTMNMMMNGGAGAMRTADSVRIGTRSASMTFTRARATGERFFTLCTFCSVT